MKISMLLIILAVSLTLMNCSQKETVIEETQEQIQKRLDKEKAEQLILGSWRLLYINSSKRIMVDSINFNRNITFTKDGVALMNHKDDTEQYRLEFKYKYYYTEERGGRKYIYAEDYQHDNPAVLHNSFTLRANSIDTLFALNSKIEGFMTYVRVIKQ